MGTEALAAARSRSVLYQRWQRLLAETAALAETELAPRDFYRGMLQRALAGTSAAAGAIWTRGADGVIRAEYRINESPEAPDGAQTDELLYQAFQSGQPLAVAPQETVGSACNPTAHFLLIAPIRMERRTAALIALRLESIPDSDLRAALLHFVTGLAHQASLFARDDRLRTLSEQQRTWLELEEFSRQVHTGLDFTAVAYTVANEGRRLVGCDRLCVAGRRGRRAVLEAVSGADTIDPRASQVYLLGRLASDVLAWGEPLVYRGAPDETLPPAVRRSLDAYLAESRGLFLAIRPLREPEETKSEFALVAECFEPVADSEPLLARLEVIGRHATSALANAARMRRVPFRRLWATAPGNSGFGWALVLVLAVLALATALTTVSCPLKMDAGGQLLPRQRRWLYSSVEGRVIRFEQGVEPGTAVRKGQAMLLMYDVQLELKLVQMVNELAAAEQEIAGLAVRQNTVSTEAERSALAGEKRQAECVRNRKLAALQTLREQTCSDEAKPGYFSLKAPIDGTVLNGDFRERLTNRLVKPSDPLVRIGERDRDWEVELKIPHRNLGHVLEGFAAADELDVDLLLLSAPTRRYRGKLARTQLAAQAAADPDGGDPEPSVRASVRIDGSDIPTAERIPLELRLTGTEVRAKVRCGDRPAGFALFHGVWEFLYENVFFF